MKKICLFFLSFFFTISAFAKSPSLKELLKDASEKFSQGLDGQVNALAIIDIHSDYQNLNNFILTELNHNLAGSMKKTVIIERSDKAISLIQKELDYQYSGFVSDESVQSLCQSLGADCLIYGNIEDVVKGWQLTLKAVKVESKGLLMSWQGLIDIKDREANFQIQTSEISADSLVQENPILTDFPQASLAASTENSSLGCRDIYEIFFEKIQKNAGKYISLGYALYDSEEFQNCSWCVYTESGKRGRTILGLSNGYICVYNHPKESEETQSKEDIPYIMGNILSDYLEDSAKVQKKYKKTFTKDEIKVLEKYLADTIFDENYRAMDLLLESGAGINSFNDLGYTALMAASYQGKEKILEKLIQAGAKVNEKNTEGQTALHIGVKAKSDDIVKILSESGANINLKDYSGNYPLTLACTDDLDKIAKILIQAGGDVNSKGAYDVTPLFECAEHNSIKCAKLLIKSGANVNHKSSEGSTPLMISCLYSNYEVAKALIDSGADVNIRSQEGDTALSIALVFSGKDIVDLLLSKGARR